MKILIVDDLFVIRKYTTAVIHRCISDVLAAANKTAVIEIDSADGGTEAILKCSTIKYDIIFMDMIMPDDIDGLTAANAIKKFGKSQDSVIIGYSMKSDDHEFVKAALKHGSINFFIKKPLNPDDFKNIISHEYFSSKGVI